MARVKARCVQTMQAKRKAALDKLIETAIECGDVQCLTRLLNNMARETRKADDRKVAATASADLKTRRKKVAKARRHVVAVFGKRKPQRR